MSPQELAEYVRDRDIMLGAVETHRQQYPHSTVIELIIPEGTIPVDSVHFQNMRNWLRDSYKSMPYQISFVQVVQGVILDKPVAVVWFSDAHKAVEFKLRWTGTIE